MTDQGSTRDITRLALRACEPDGRLFAVRRAFECKDCLRERIGDEEFIADRVVSNIVHRPAQ